VSAALIDRLLDNWQINRHIKCLIGLLTTAPLSMIGLVALFLSFLTFCLVFAEDEVSRDT
jgi:cyanate permease